MSAPSTARLFAGPFASRPGTTTVLRDASGYALYAEGEAGAAHVVAHRMLDTGRARLGHRLLGRWLAHHAGRGRHWVHLQWHMAVFEIELGHWHAALARFQREIRPYAFGGADAVTDAPSLLWRLRLAAPGPVALPWAEVRRTARRDLHRARDRYVRLHHLLALAGAGDLVALDRWLAGGAAHDGTRAGSLLWGLGQGLRAYAAGAYGDAAHHLADGVPHVAELGGSRAQNRLFVEIQRAAHARSKPAAQPAVAAYAA